MDREARHAPSAWEGEAADWIRWTRTPGHDVFPYYMPAFFSDVVPPPSGLTLEVGCGEGRVMRELAARRHRVVGLDASPSLLRAAHAADRAPAYTAGDATALPFANATFDTVVAYNSLQTMTELDDMARALAEAARVMKPTGHLCACVSHPLTDVGRLAGPSDDSNLTMSGSYFEHQRVDDTVTKDGLTMTFHGWTYSIEDYVSAIEDAGLLIERMREPRPDEHQAAARPSLERWRRVPLFLFVRATKR